MAARAARIMDSASHESLAESDYVAAGRGDGVGGTSIGDVAAVGDRRRFICVVLRTVGLGRRGVGRIGAASAWFWRATGRAHSKEPAADANDAGFLVRAGAEFGNNDLSRGGPYRSSGGIPDDVSADSARSIELCPVPFRIGRRRRPYPVSLAAASRLADFAGEGRSVSSCLSGADISAESAGGPGGGTDGFGGRARTVGEASPIASPMAILDELVAREWGGASGRNVYRGERGSQDERPIADPLRGDLWAFGMVVRARAGSGVK